MYILIHIGINAEKHNEISSQKKNKIVAYIKDKGYYWSSKNKRYINDKTIEIPGGDGNDYIIENLEEL